MRSLTQKIGKSAEDSVCKHLQQYGLKLVVANYRCKYGEIDLIMLDGKTLVFVEVRYRRCHDYGDGVATVTKSKQRRIIKTAIDYLLKNNLYDKSLCRFDVVAASGSSENKINWIKNAFWEKW
jgi:putative endonuclease